MKTMKGIYFENDGDMAYYIGSFKEDDEKFLEIEDIKQNIAKSAFAHSDVEYVLFKNCSPNIGEKTFEGCESLATVIFGELEKDKTFEKHALKNLTPTTPSGNNFTSLTTLVLPKLSDEHTLIIEKDAFCGCDAMRMVVALCGEIDFTENPFALGAENLTFICKKDSAVVRFARESGYRSMYVE